MVIGSFPGVKRPGRGVDHPHPSRTDVKEEVELYLHSPSGHFVACTRLNFLYSISVFTVEVNMTGLFMQIYYGVRIAVFPASDNALHKMEFA